MLFTFHTVGTGTGSAPPVENPLQSTLRVSPLSLHLWPVKAAWDSGLNPQLETTAWCLSTQTSKGKHSLAVLLVQADFSEKQAALILSVWGENRILSSAFLIHNKGYKISFLVLRMGPAYSAPSGLWVTNLNRSQRHFDCCGSFHSHLLRHLSVLRKCPHSTKENNIPFPRPSLLNLCRFICWCYKGMVSLGSQQCLWKDKCL